MLLQIEQENNPDRKLEGLKRKERLDDLKERLDGLLDKKEKDVRSELEHIDRDWQVYEHLQKEKESIKEKARRVLNEQQRRYITEVGNFRQHKQKVEGKQKAQREVETTIMRDIQTLQRNLKEKVGDLIARGIDLDELFYEMREDEEIKFEKDVKIEVEKSAIAKHIGFRLIIGLKVPERKKNTEIQTYNVDFLID